MYEQIRSLDRKRQRLDILLPVSHFEKDFVTSLRHRHIGLEIHHRFEPCRRSLLYEMFGTSESLLRSHSGEESLDR